MLEYIKVKKLEECFPIQVKDIETKAVIPIIVCEEYFPEYDGKFENIKTIGNFAMLIKKLHIENEYNISSKEELYNEILKTLDTFRELDFYHPYSEFNVNDKSKDALIKSNEIYSIERASNKICIDTKRGRATTIVKTENFDYYFYLNENHPKSDSPIFITEFEGKYAITLHPEYKRYGFKVNKNIIKPPSYNPNLVYIDV